MRRKDAAVCVQSKAAAESEEGSGNGEGRCAIDAAQMGVSVHPHVYRLPFPSGCAVRGMCPLLNHPVFPETFLVQTLPAPVLASSDCGRTPRPAAQMSQRPDFSLSGGASWCGNLPR